MLKPWRGRLHVFFDAKRKQRTEKRDFHFFEKDWKTAKNKKKKKEKPKEERHNRKRKNTKDTPKRKNRKIKCKKNTKRQEYIHPQTSACVCCWRTVVTLHRFWQSVLHVSEPWFFLSGWHRSSESKQQTTFIMIIACRWFGRSPHVKEKRKRKFWRSFQRYKKVLSRSYLSTEYSCRNNSGKKL